MNPNVPSKKTISYGQLIPKDWGVKAVKNCNYVFIDGKGEKHIHISDVCFARFQNGYGIKKAVMLINQHEKPSTYSDNHKYMGNAKFRKQLREYIMWVVKKSPFRFAFINGKKDFFKEGLKLNCNVPHKYVFGACTAIREGWEFPWRVEWWHKAIEKGLSPELAYYAASHTGINSGFTGNSGHSVLTQNVNTGAIKWFKDLTLDSVKAISKSMSNSASSIYGVGILFAGKGGVSFTNKLKGYCKKTGEGWDVRYVLDLDHEPLLTYLKGVDRA